MYGRFKYAAYRTSWIPDFSVLGYNSKVNPSNNYQRYFNSKWRKIYEGINNRYPRMNFSLYKKYVNDYFILMNQAIADGYCFDLGEGIGTIRLTRRWVEPYINKKGNFSYNLYNFKEKRHREPQWMFQLYWHKGKGKGRDSNVSKKLSYFKLVPAQYANSTKEKVALSNGDLVERVFPAAAACKKNDAYLAKIPLHPRYVKMKAIQLIERGY